jgi:DNA-binding MarR family transcriptional regulator
MTSESPFNAMGVPGLLRAARGAYGKAVRAAFTDAGFDDIPRSGAFVLARTFDNTSPLGTLTRELGISKQAVSQLIDTMVMRGYLERTADTEDRRRMLIKLTARGEEAARVAWQAVTTVDQELADRLSPEGTAALRAGLIALAEISLSSGPAPE